MIILVWLMFVALTVALAALEALVAAWAWGAFLVPIFGLKAITWVQAFAAVLLLKIISGSFKVKTEVKQ